MELFRLEQSKQGAIGALVIEGELCAITLEPDDKDPDRNQIPEGTYFCKRRIAPGAKYPETFEIMVPGHTHVLFHWGNTEDDTEMCIILGQYADYFGPERAVLNSRNTFNKFMDLLENIDWFYITITNLY